MAVMSSKINKNEFLVNGNSHPVKSKEELEEYILKGYDAECGSGFYCIQDIEIAKKYAISAAMKDKSPNSAPTLNFYQINLDKIAKELLVAYFNEVENEETLYYLGCNLSGRFPDFCKRKDDLPAGATPTTECYKCVSNCKWCAPYVEAILSDGNIYQLDSIFKDFYNKKITKEEATRLIYKQVDDSSDLKIQVVLRGVILDVDNYDYLKYVDSITLGSD